MRDATSEAVFFQVYGHLYALHFADARQVDERVDAPGQDPLQLPFVQQALARIGEGGLAEAVARVASLLAADDVQIPLAAVELEAELASDYAGLLPALTPAAWRLVRGEQDIVVRYARDRAIATLPRLLQGRGDRQRFLELVRKLAADPRLLRREVSEHDRLVLERVGEVLAASPPRAAPTKVTTAG
jgi:hypothetical protein